MKVRTFVLLMVALSVVVGFGVFWLAVRPDLAATVFVAAISVPAAVIGAVRALRAIDPDRLELTLREVRRREREGTLDPAFSEEQVRTIGRRSLAAFVFSAVIVVPAAWVVFGRRTGIVIAGVAALGAFSSYFAQRMMRRSLRR